MRKMRLIGLIGIVFVILVIFLLKLLHKPSFFAVPFLLPFLVMILIDMSGRNKSPHA
ncbi:MAG TPA: hypothetical protein PK323_02510 [Bacteroidia bacterium]|nr:hypothetical protein [Bacteroidia bacterium]